MRGDIEDEAAHLFVTWILVVNHHINNDREFVFLLILYSSSLSLELILEDKRRRMYVKYRFILEFKNKINGARN